MTPVWWGPFRFFDILKINDIVIIDTIVNKCCIQLVNVFDAYVDSLLLSCK